MVLGWAEPQRIGEIEIERNQGASFVSAEFDQL